ncbi:MAG: LacI family DNA-binding transcriptional regulator [Chloroflexi bacterium]|nr:LacI family DNA-binding transcriptional regulator [Chloroflexota bacterium]
MTIEDVAREAGVSRQTVSRAINNKAEISADTLNRVLEAVDKLGYRPSRMAQGLATQHTFTVGLVVSDITNPFFPEVARGVLDAAQQRGYNVFLCNTDGNLQQELRILQSLADHAVDGIIIYPSYDSDDNLKTIVEQYQRPLVLVNHSFKHHRVSNIMVDNPRGARLAVDYLVSKGHTAIGMLTGVLNPFRDRVRRIQGFRQALAAHGLPVVEEWIVPGLDPTFVRGYEAGRYLLTQHPQVTAIFTYNDLLALGAIRACHELGRRIPDDCAIIGFDDIRWAATATPALTSIGVNKHYLGEQAVTRLLAMLENPESTFSPIYVDVELVIRESA